MCTSSPIVGPSTLNPSLRLFESPIVTLIEPDAPFYEAEAYHQGYYRGHASQPYCAAVISPKVAKLRSKFRDRLKPEEAAAQG